MMVCPDQQQHASPPGPQQDTPSDLTTADNRHVQASEVPSTAWTPTQGSRLRGTVDDAQHLATFLPTNLQERPLDWFLLDPSAPVPPPHFTEPIDPFLAHADTDIVDFGLPTQLEGEGAGHDSNITPLPSPLDGVSSPFHFDFDFNPTLWGPAQPAITADETALAAGTAPSAFSGTPSVGGGGDAFLTDDRADSTGLSRRGHRSGKTREGSTASSSIYSDSVASPADVRALPSPLPNTSNPLAPPRGAERRRSNRTKTRARSVATTASASSSSTAPTPSSISGASATAAGRSKPSSTPPTHSFGSGAGTLSQSKLRSASRASKNSASKPSDTPEERRTRASHNLVEKQYRNRLNAQFEGLLSALPDHGDGRDPPGSPTTAVAGVGAEGGDQADRKVSKAEVLERARQHIETLERETEALRREREVLLANLLRAESELVSSGGGAVAGGGGRRGGGGGGGEGGNRLETSLGRAGGAGGGASYEDRGEVGEPADEHTRGP